MATWYPGVMSYGQWCQANSFLNDLKIQSNQIKNSIHEQTRAISDQTKTIIASNEQITFAFEKSFDRLFEINERGFNRITSSIEAMHSDLNYNLGILIQKFEFQNKLLSNILNTLQSPFETRIIELYNNGCKFIRQENVDAAIDCFKESISQKMGKYFFPSYYQLGRLYISGRFDNKNIIDPKIATEYLIKANELGNGIVKDDISFNPILADCKYFLSQSFYFQLTGKNDTKDIELVNNAIKYCEEAVSINPNLSQGFYHLAKYYSCKNEVNNLLQNFNKAIMIDRHYSLQYEEDKVFERNKKHIYNLLIELKEQLKQLSSKELQKAKGYISSWESKEIMNFKNLISEFNSIKEKVSLAELDFKTATLFGYDDCFKNITKNEFEKLSEKLNKEIQLKIDKENEAKRSDAQNKRQAESYAIKLALKGVIAGLIAAFIIGGTISIWVEDLPDGRIILLTGAIIGGIGGYKLGYWGIRN